MTRNVRLAWALFKRMGITPESAPERHWRYCEQCKRVALHGPPMTAQEVREHRQAVELQRVADEARRQN